MDVHPLSFGRLIIVQPDLAEIIVNEGIEMNSPMIVELYDFLKTHMNSPFFLLINKVNEYTYDTDVQFNFATIEDIHSVAVAADTRAKRLITKNLALVAGVNPDAKNLSLKIFTNRDQALEWLIGQKKAKQ